MKTNAARLLDSLGIAYEIREYEVDPDDLAAEKTSTVFADETIELFDAISVSAGVRGAQLILGPADYIRATNARVGAIAKAK